MDMTLEAWRKYCQGVRKLAGKIDRSIPPRQPTLLRPGQIFPRSGKGGTRKAKKGD